MLRFSARPGHPGYLEGLPRETFVEVRFQDRSRGGLAVRVARSDFHGDAHVDFPGFTRAHSVSVRQVSGTQVHRLVYSAEQPTDGTLVLIDPEDRFRPVAATSPIPSDDEEGN